MAKMGKIREMDEETRKAYEFLQKYALERDVSDICELFKKETLVDNVCQADWDWSVQDEMDANGLSRNAAVDATEKWFLEMTNEELFYERIGQPHQFQLIGDMAENLGFEFE